MKLSALERRSARVALPHRPWSIGVPDGLPTVRRSPSC
jgi:hypothetical protein